MRQIGILAAAARHAVDNHRARLADDHENAKRFGAIVRESGKAQVEEPETNVVMVDLAVDAGRVVTALGERGVLLSAFGPQRLRVVTHLDVSRAEVETAANALVEVLGK